jgi:hypothetical protein
MSEKAKWETNPVVIFDVEFSDDEILTELAYLAIDIINAELKDIQLSISFSSQNFHSLSTHLQQGGSISSYNTYLTNLTNNNQGNIVVQLDNGFSSFGGEMSSNIGIVKLKTAEYLNLVNGGTAIGGNSRWQEFGIHYVMLNVLVHEILHAMNIRHQVEPIEGLTNIARRTKPIMHYAVNRGNYGLTDTDKQAIHSLYGVPCEKNEVQIEFGFETNSLAVTFLPVRKKIRKLIRMGWGERIRPGYESRVNGNAVTVGVFDNKAVARLNRGNYIVLIRGIGGFDPMAAFKPDIEGGVPSFEGTKFFEGL